MIQIEEPQAKKMMKEGAIPGELSRSASKVAVIMSQSWCPQWLAMKLWLNRLKDNEEDLRIYYLEYDRAPWFHQFMQFKESVLGNDLVPYLRYFKDGEYLGDSNFCSKEGFLSYFE